jgi:hypothetical protein
MVPCRKKNRRRSGELANLFDLENPLSRYGSHSAGAGAQSDEQFHTVSFDICCSSSGSLWPI